MGEIIFLNISILILGFLIGYYIGAKLGLDESKTK